MTPDPSAQMREQGLRVIQRTNGSAFLAFDGPRGEALEDPRFPQYRTLDFHDAMSATDCRWVAIVLTQKALQRAFAKQGSK